MLFTTKGMNQDLSVSKFNPEFAFENRNLRLSTNDGNTLLSWVNERGPKKLEFIVGEPLSDTDARISDVSKVVGIPLGTAIIND